MTISGLPGSGKSTVAKGVAENLGFRHYSTGNIQRELAKERGLSITEWGEREAADKSFDEMIDNKTKEIAEREEDMVMDSWLAPHFVKDAFKIFLECREEERARRRLYHKRKEERFESMEDTLRDMRERVESNRQRWLRFYGYDFLDKGNYDVVVDTTKLDSSEVIEKVTKLIEEWRAEQK